jgi:hypothetical protein
MMEEMIYQELVTQVLFSYPDETIYAITGYFDEELDYILQVYDRSATLFWWRSWSKCFS